MWKKHVRWPYKYTGASPYVTRHLTTYRLRLHYNILGKIVIYRWITFTS